MHHNIYNSCCSCVLAFLFGVSCITVAGLSSLVDLGVLQVKDLLHCNIQIGIRTRICGIIQT